MATTITTCDDSVYVEVSTADGLVQNKSSGLLRVVFDVSLPATDTEAFHVLARNEAIQKLSDVPAGNIYVRSDTGKHNKVAFST